MPKTFIKPSPVDLAKRIYSSYCAILYADTGREELRWEDLTGAEQNGFAEAVDMVLSEEFEKVADAWDEALAEIDHRASERVSGPSPSDADFKVFAERLFGPGKEPVPKYEMDPSRPCYGCGQVEVYNEEYLCKTCKS